MHWMTLTILCVVLLVYVLVGAAIFMALEKTNEEEVATTQSATFTQFLTDNTCVTSSELSTFARAVIQAYDAGVVATGDTSSTSNWEYGPSVFFSITVVTSIGYGHISPSTSGGQVFFIFYAILGIPFTALILSAIGEKFAKPYKRLEKKQLFPQHPKKERIGKLIVFTSICFVLFSLIPAVIFMVVENWSYLEAWYYTIVTLTTVGFGDYVPAQDESNVRGFYKVLVTGWIFIGLSWLAMVMNLIQDFFKDQSTKLDGEIDNDGKTDKDKKEDEKAEVVEMKA